jgi:hypothetical protein
MKKNMGTADRTIRILIALAIAILFFTGRITGVIALVLGIVAAAFFVTSLAGSCPAYLPFGLSTCGKSGESSD